MGNDFGLIIAIVLVLVRVASSQNRVPKNAKIAVAFGRKGLFCEIVQVTAKVLPKSSTFSCFCMMVVGGILHFMNRIFL